MPTTVLRPNGNSSGETSFTITGSANAWAVLADDLDASFIRKQVGITGQAAYVSAIADTSIGATQLVRGVRVRARALTNSGTSAKFYCELGTRVSAVDYYAAPLKLTTVAGATTYTGPWVTSSPDGAKWDQARVNAIRVRNTEYLDGNDRTTLYELYVDVDVATQPTVAVTSPSGTYTTTSRPDVTWTYTDSENLAQKWYEVKVFSAIQYGAVGFNPTTDISTWESGQVQDVTQTVGVGAFLANGTYRAYVRAAKDVNNSPFFSAWVYSEFTINVTPPVTPTVTGSYDATTNVVNLTVTGGALPAGYVSQTFLLERSTDGTFFEAVRNASALAPNGSYVATVTDYEAERGVNVYYRARTFGVNASDTIGSVYSSNLTVAISNDGKWWLKAVRNPELNMGNVRVTGDIPVEMSQPTAVLQPIGTTRNIVVTGNLHGEDGSFDIITIGDDEWFALEPLLIYTNTLLVQSPFGSQKLIRITKRNYSTTGARTKAVRRISIDYIEVSE